MGGYTSYIIGAILVVITLIIIGLVLRKRIYDQVDKLEAWKMDIMHRQVTAELQRVKALNLSGETQDKFESWKETWDQILTRELPDIEEFLFDAEEAADRFRINTSKKNLKTVESILNQIEETIEKMYQELEELLDSEKQSRNEVEKVLPRIKALRHTLLENRHLYGQAEQRYENEINEQQVNLDRFYSECDEGNYLEARQIIAAVNEQLDDLTVRMEEFPIIFKKLKRELPERLNELKAGIKEMKQAGYRIDNDAYDKELTQFDSQLEDYIHHVEEKENPEIYEWLTHVEERIQEIYATLENEAKAKQYIERHTDQASHDLQTQVSVFDQTAEEVAELQKTYLLEGRDLELYDNLQKWMHQIERDYNQLLNGLSNEEETYSVLKDQLDLIRQDLEKFHQSHIEFQEQVRMIRKDEIAAKSSIITLGRQVYELEKLLTKSNLPGVPSYLWSLDSEAKEAIQQVEDKLAMQPLDMGEVNHKLKEAEQAVDILSKKAQLMIEQAYLVEQVIQYANRYRSQYPMLKAKLLEAEQLFYHFHYEEALELATQSLEEVDPGAVKRLESKIELPV